jgi:hypothetical protein
VIKDGFDDPCGPEQGKWQGRSPATKENGGAEAPPFDLSSAA